MIVVLVTLAATLAIQLGYFLWKIAADELPRIGTAPAGTVALSFVTNWKWMLGFFLTVVGWLFFVKATDLGEVSIVQPLMSVGDIFLVLLAITFLHERLGRVEWVGLAFTVVGAVLLAFEASVIERVVIAWPRLIVFLALCAAGWLALFLAGRRSARSEVPLAIAVGIGFGMGATLTKLMTAYLTLGGQQLESSAFLLNPILPFMVAANVAGLALLQVAFQRGRASVIIPVQLAVANGLVVIAGALVFAEAIGPMRLFGICVIVTGTTALEFGRRAAGRSGMH
jgi:uncharacterized membrane protein